MSDYKISAKDVKKLREQTGVGMMDCKKALVDSEGDFEKAIELLRKKGEKLSAKRADREAKEGCILAVVSDDNQRGVIVKLSSETDFVSKNEEFIARTKEIAAVALDQFPESKEDLLNASIDGKTVNQFITEVVAAFQEKIVLTDYVKIESDGVAPYIHMGNKAGVLVGLNIQSDDTLAAGRNIAMQVAAMKPIALDKDGIDPSVIEKEIEIGKDLARQAGKPEQIIEKIALGKLNKFFKENTLLSQQYVKDSSLSVSEYLKTVDKDLTVVKFKHISLG